MNFNAFNAICFVAACARAAGHATVVKFRLLVEIKSKRTELRLCVSNCCTRSTYESYLDTTTQ